MLDSGLFRLYQLHLVDAHLHELKSRAGALDVGQAESALMKQKMAETAEIRELPKTLRQEQTDLELEQKGLSDKKKTLNAKLYGGSVVNSKEIAAMEKEIVAISERIDKIDDRLLELLEELPAAEGPAKAAERELVVLKKKVQEKQAAAKEEHEVLRAAYAQEAKKRPAAAQPVPAHLMGQYDAVKNRIGVPAMAVITPSSSCGACGILLPERVIQMVRQDRVVNCESCRRILFSPVPEAE